MDASSNGKIRIDVEVALIEREPGEPPAIALPDVDVPLDYEAVIVFHAPPGYVISDFAIARKGLGFPPATCKAVAESGCDGDFTWTVAGDDQAGMTLTLEDRNTAVGAFKYRMAFTGNGQTIEGDPGVGNGGRYR